MAHIYATRLSVKARSFRFGVPLRRYARRRPYWQLKRAIDLLICLLMVPIALSLIGLLAVLIVIDSPGPALFVQWRVGAHGRRFRMYKLRTMVQDAESVKRSIAHKNELTWPDFKVRNDPRVTRVGRLLRRTSLDELPQLFNVVKGEMSLVGPRPHSFAVETYQFWQVGRLEVMPGITGLAQVTSRSKLHFDQRVRLDLEYIRRQSLWLDCWIVLRTIQQVIVGDGTW